MPQKIMKSSNFRAKFIAKIVKFVSLIQIVVRSSNLVWTHFGDATEIISSNIIKLHVSEEYLKRLGKQNWKAAWKLLCETYEKLFPISQFPIHIDKYLRVFLCIFLLCMNSLPHSAKKNYRKILFLSRKSLAGRI